MAGVPVIPHDATFVNCAPDKSTPARLVPAMTARDRFAFLRFAVAKVAPTMVALERFIPERSAPRKSAPVIFAVGPSK